MLVKYFKCLNNSSKRSPFNSNWFSISPNFDIELQKFHLVTYTIPKVHPL